MTDPLKSRPGAQSKSDHPALGLGFVFGQLVLIALLLHQLDLLPVNVRRVIYLGVPGFLANHLLPQRLRLAFFAFLSVGCLFLSLEVPVSYHFWYPASFARASIVLAVGAMLAGVCLLPIGFWKRAGLLVIAGAVMAAFRTDLIPNGGFEILGIVIPMIFMFRIVSYLYDVSTSPTRPTAAQTVSYFFLSPIACFSTLIPIIDFKTFCRSHYNDIALAIYQRGIHRMARGVFQLLLYRYVAQVFSIEYSRIANGTDLLRYLATSPLFYLNVSGHFHFITGFLLLFGFNLPATNYNYLLASSFTDLWRRVNIYWKDFTLKIFYYPAYFRLKKLGATPALVIATLWIFVLSWAFHVYFVFWNSGAVRTSLKHLLFWLILGTFVLINSLWEMRKGRKRTTASSTFNLKDSIWLTVKTAATFTTMWIVLDTFGNSPSFSAWVELWQHADWHTLVGILGIVLVVMAAKVVLEILPTWSKKPGTASPAQVAIDWRRDIRQSAAPLAGLYLVTFLAINYQLPNLRSSGISSKINFQRFYDLLEAGDSFLTDNGSEELNIYKTKTFFQEGSRQLDEVFIGRHIPPYSQNGIAPVTETHDYRASILNASQKGFAYETADFQTNRWGMRDRDYGTLKQPQTRRIAILGGANEMGYAIRQDQMFDSLLEQQLNQGSAATATVPDWEVLNFAQVGFSPLAQVDVLQQQVGAFQPDVVLLFGHSTDPSAMNFRLRMMQRKGEPIPDEFLQKTLADARVIRYINLGLAEKRLQPFESALMNWSLARIADECRSIRAQPVFAFLPDVGEEIPLSPAQLKKADEFNAMARNAGFLVIDLSHVFDHVAASTLVTGKIPHSSAIAHRLIAQALSQALTDNPGLAKLASDQKETSSGNLGGSAL